MRKKDPSRRYSPIFRRTRRRCARRRSTPKPSIPSRAMLRARSSCMRGRGVRSQWEPDRLARSLRWRQDRTQRSTVLSATGASSQLRVWGKVAAASTSIQNGFEYQYEATADAASEYAKARAELDPLASESQAASGRAVRSRRRSAWRCVEHAHRCAAARFARCRGPRGGSRPRSGVYRVRKLIRALDGASWGARAAVSSATLLAEPANEGANVVSSLLDGLSGEGGQAVGVLGRGARLLVCIALGVC